MSVNVLTSSGLLRLADNKIQQPNIFDDLSGDLVLVDNEDNIIARINSEGIETTYIKALNIQEIEETLIPNINSNIEKLDSETIKLVTADDPIVVDPSENAVHLSMPNLTENEEDALIIQDPEGFKIAEFNHQGFNTTNIQAKTVNFNGKDLEEEIARIDAAHELLDSETIKIVSTDDSSIIEISATTNEVVLTTPNLNQGNEGEFIIGDSYGNKIAEFNSEGLTTTAITVIENGNQIATIDDQGIKVDTIILNGKNLETERIQAVIDELTQLKVDIDNLSNIMNFIGELQGYADGDNYVITSPGKPGDVGVYAGAEFVYVNDTTKWIEIGDVSAEQARISDLEDTVVKEVILPDNSIVKAERAENTVNLSTPNITEDNDAELSVIDDKGNRILTVNDTGVITTNLHTQTINYNGKNLEDEVRRIDDRITVTTNEINQTIEDEVADLNNTITTEVNGLNNTITTEVSKINSAHNKLDGEAIKNVYAATDSLIVVAPGTNSVTLDTPNLHQGNSNEFTLVDSNGYKIATFAADGLLTTKVAAAEMVVNSINVEEALKSKQPNLTFDSTPTSGSNNPITSGGVYTALANFSTIPYHVGTTAPTNTKLFWIDTANGLKYYDTSSKTWKVVPVAWS